MTHPVLVLHYSPETKADGACAPESEKIWGLDLARSEGDGEGWTRETRSREQCNGKHGPRASRPPPRERDYDF